MITILQLFFRLEEKKFGFIMNRRKSIEQFLSCKNVVIAGVSSKGKGFGVVVYNHLKKAGYNVFGLNIKGGLLNNEKLFTSLDAIPFKIDAVVTVVPPQQTEKIIDEIILKNINHVWMQQGSESEKSIGKCISKGINVISGECILMYAEPVKSIHSVHRFINKLVGRYPN